jgi:hypothetical protein
VRLGDRDEGAQQVDVEVTAQGMTFADIGDQKY